MVWRNSKTEMSNTTDTKPTSPTIEVPGLTVPTASSTKIKLADLKPAKVKPAKILHQFDPLDVSNLLSDDQRWFYAQGPGTADNPYNIQEFHAASLCLVEFPDASSASVLISGTEKTGLSVMLYSANQEGEIDIESPVAACNVGFNARRGNMLTVTPGPGLLAQVVKSDKNEGQYQALAIPDSVPAEGEDREAGEKQTKLLPNFVRSIVVQYKDDPKIVQVVSAQLENIGTIGKAASTVGRMMSGIKPDMSPKADNSDYGA